MTRKLLCLPAGAAALLFVAASVGAAPANAASVLIVPVADDASGAGPAVTRAVETAVLERIPTLSVVTPRSLGDKVEIDLMRACEGSDDATCTAQFSDALGVELVLRPQLSQLGDVMLLSLSLYDVKGAAVLAQGQRQAQQDRPEALLALIPGLVVEVGQRGGLPVHVERPKPFPFAPVIGLTSGAVLVLGGVGLGGYGAWQESRYQGAAMSRSEASSWEDARPLVFGGAAVVAVAGAILVGYGAVTLLE